jgi:hypothetical protein
MKKIVALAISLLQCLFIFPQKEKYPGRVAPSDYTENSKGIAQLADSNIHVLTIFVMNSIKPINWESPSTLVESTIKGYKAKLLHPRQYLLGHMIARLQSPLVGGTKYSAMVSTSMREKRVLMLKEQVGLGILGLAMGGKLDTEKDMLRDLKFTSRMDNLAYVKYKISEESARKIILFMEGFSSSTNGDLSPCNYYGGAFWPRYYNEGAGCSAYGMSMIDVAGFLEKEHNYWKVVVNIPLELVGGELNHGKKVSTKEILKGKSWVSDVLDQDYIHFSIYDPSFIYEWIMENRNKTGDGNYINDEENNIPGLFSDKTNIKPSREDPVFLPRPEPLLFIEHYVSKRSKRILQN